MRRLLASVVAALLVFIVPGGSQAMEKVGFAGPWVVGCEWNPYAKKAICFVGGQASRPEYQISFLYYPFQREFTVMAKVSPFEIRGRVDDGPVEKAHCAYSSCTFAQASFIDRLVKGRALTLMFSTHGTEHFEWIESIADLARAIAMANDWAEQEAKKH